VTYFFDNNISPRLVNILRELGVDALHLKQVFPEGTDDVDWLPRAGQEAWIVITADREIRRNSVERTALTQNRVTALFLQRSFLKRNKWPQAEWLIKPWLKIDEQAQKLRPGTQKGDRNRYGTT
jgi:predicted nuclease of predicted toxin-antitoxin system